MERGDFLKFSAITGATAALDSCGRPEHQRIRFIPEEDLVPGIATWKPSICTLCPAGCGTNFVFWIGISHAGTLIAAILRLANATWRRPVTRCAEVITVFALSIGAMFPRIHLGQPWVAFWLISYPSERRDLAQLPPAAGLGFQGRSEPRLGSSATAPTC